MLVGVIFCLANHDFMSENHLNSNPNAVQLRLCIASFVLMSCVPEI